MVIVSHSIRPICNLDGRMRNIYKSAKVIYNAHERQYEVWYKTWFRWSFDSCYKVDKYITDERAKELAIERAQGLLDTVEVWKKSNFDYYHG